MKSYILFICLYFYLFNQFNSNSNQFDEIRIYSLSMYSNYLTRVPCDKLIEYEGLIQKRITDKKRIAIFQKALFDSNNFKLDSSRWIDSRVRIEFKRSGNVVNTFCLSKTNLIEFNGKIYSYNEKVENLLKKGIYQ